MGAAAVTGSESVAGFGVALDNVSASVGVEAHSVELVGREQVQFDVSAAVHMVGFAAQQRARRLAGDKAAEPQVAERAAAAHIAVAAQAVLEALD